MRLPLRKILLLALLLLGLGQASRALSQDLSARSELSESRRIDPLQLTKTGARRTAVVLAIEKTKSAVVNIHSERTINSAAAEMHSLTPSQNRVNGMGTGIIIDPRGLIVTNHHVVEDVNVLRIRLADGTSANAQVIARSPETDLALIKIDVNQQLPVMPLGTAHDLLVGETVIAIGNAFGYEHTASLGIVSAIKRDVSLNKDMSYKSLIQTDAAINPGNSGGPLINVNGDLIGVNVAIRAGAQGIGFAIPVDNMVKAVSEMLRQRRRGGFYEGLSLRDHVELQGESLQRLVVVERADPGSPAAQAGFRPGDVLVAVGDTRLICSYDYERALLDRKPGDAVPVTYRRQGQEQKAQVTLATVTNARPVAQTDGVWARLGIELSPVGAPAVASVNRQLQGGLEIAAIDASGLAARSGLRKGDILVGLHQWETVSSENVMYVLNHPELGTFNPLPFFIIRQGQVRRGAIQLTN
ncbi:MAG: trypsin-like peptidase domain-containing protein [Gemmataceae bacterium]|nr:trypsin-like peptidase domain-containing protein [Gemmataceae bacterium]